MGNGNASANQMKPPSSTGSDAAVRPVERDARLYRELGLFDSQVAEHAERWKNRFANPRRPFLSADGRVDVEVLRNFNRHMIFNSDNPRLDANPRNPLNHLIGSRRGERAIMKKCLRTLRDYGRLDILKRHPASLVGNPRVFVHEGYTFTHSWFRNVYLAGLLRETLGDRLPPGFVALDIGGAYGAFSSLIHLEHPGSHNIIVDLPAQLLLARYFLTCSFPAARVAGIQELAGLESIPRDFIKEYDFVLISPGEYLKLTPGAVDLMMSFLALGELKREFFEHYVNAPVFRSAKYFMTANPVARRSALCVLDYPIGGVGKRIHFAISGAYDYTYSLPKSRRCFFFELRRFPPFFEYVGEI